MNVVEEIIELENITTEIVNTIIGNPEKYIINDRVKELLELLRNIEFDIFYIQTKPSNFKYLNSILESRLYQLKYIINGFSKLLLEEDICIINDCCAELITELYNISI